LYGGKHVTQWPYDDYHLVQQQYYVKLEELALKSESKDEDKEMAAKNNASATNNVQRPLDPPDIPTANMGLPLSNFEHKAKERSIAIVSTWLFDCGLVDELLVHGGMGNSTMASIDTHSVNTSEGIEIGRLGFPIEGPSKMDKEVSKLKSTSQRTLALINAIADQQLLLVGLHELWGGSHSRRASPWYYDAMVLRIQIHCYHYIILSGGTTSVLQSTDSLGSDRRRQASSRRLGKGARQIGICRSHLTNGRLP
jgi:hypothetical protein